MNINGNPNWKKGVSANPDGRPPKEQALTDLLKEKADKNELVDRLLEWSKKDSTILRYVFDRIDGKPRETVKTIIETPSVVWYDKENDETDSENKTTG